MDDNKIKSAAQSMRLEYLNECSGAGVPVALNTNKFIRVVSEKLNITIETKVVSGSKIPDLLGLMYLSRPQNGSPKATILISDHNNECWKRFIAIKEVSHLFIDQKQTADMSKLARSLVESSFMSLSNMSDEQRTFFEREVSGVIAAIEILIPDSLEQWAKHAYHVSKLSTRQIACQLKVPQKYVDHRLVEWGIIQPPE